MPAFTRLYLDTNILHASRWPQVSARLSGIVELATNFGVVVRIPQPVEDERESQWIREVTKAFGGLKKATKELGKQLGVVNEPAPPPAVFNLNDLRQKYRVASGTARESRGIQLSPTTGRTAAELLPYAIRRDAPFREVGDHVTGFQDAVILFSVLDDAYQAGGTPCALLSADGDFAGSEVATAAVDVTFLHFRSFEALWGVFAAEIAPALSEWWTMDRQAAKESLQQRKDAIVAFLLGEVTPERLGAFVKDLRSAKIDDVAEVETPLPPFPNFPGPYARTAGSAVPITAKLKVSFDVLATEVSFSVIAALLGRSKTIAGETAESPVEEEPREDKVVKLIEFECRGTFDGETYALDNYKVVNLT